MLCPCRRPQWTVRPRASLPNPRVRPLNTTPKAYLQHHAAKEPRLEGSTHIHASSALWFISWASSLSQFTVLDEDALSELVSFFEDLLIVDVGHGGYEALEEEQDMTHTERSKLLYYPVPPGLPRQGRHPRFTGTEEGANILCEQKKIIEQSWLTITELLFFKRLYCV